MEKFKPQILSFYLGFEFLIKEKFDRLRNLKYNRYHKLLSLWDWEFLKSFPNTYLYTLCMHPNNALPEHLSAH